jgi:transcriptional regulator with XRE-family HTH domain
MLRLHFMIDFHELKMHAIAPLGRSKFPNCSGLKMASAVTKIIDDLRDRGGLKGTDVANITEVSPATVSRWTSGKASPHPKTQLLISDLRYIVDRLSEFYTPEETRLWLYSKHRLLGGERAIDLINRGRTDEVLGVIESLDEGTFT